MSDTAKTQNPEAPVVPVGPGITYDTDFSIRFGVDLVSVIDAVASDRSARDINLDDWDNQYEMNLPPKDWPWGNASNVYVPLTPSTLDTLVARLSSLLFGSSRFFIVAGNTEIAAGFSHDVERYYNAELWRPRRRTGYNWVEDLYNAMHLGFKDGVGVLEILWNKTTTKSKVAIFSHAVDEETQMPLTRPDGRPVIHTEIQEQDITVYDDVEWIPTELRDFYVAPAWATSIQEAPLVMRRLLIREKDLWAMTRGEKPLLWKDAVERALNFVPAGVSELAEERQGTQTYEIGGTVAVGEELGPVDFTLGKERGPLEVWRCQGDLYDFNKSHQNEGPKDPEETVSWIDYQSQTLLGVGPYEYWHGFRPFVAFTPMPRPNRFYGFSIIERLRTLQAELNAIHNQRNDAINIRLGAPMWKKQGVKFADQGMTWGPNAVYIAESKDDMGLLNLPDVPTSSWQEETRLDQLADKLSGLSNPMQGQPNPGRRSAQEIQALSQSAGIRVDLMAARFRAFARTVFWQTHQLKLQYGPDYMDANVNEDGKPKKLEIDKIKLSQDYEMAIVGQGGPLDKGNRMQEMMFLYTLLMKNPLVAQNLVRVWEITRMVLEEFNRPDIPALIGTREEVEQQQQAMQQQQAAQAGIAGAQGQRPQQQQQQGQGQQNGKPAAAAPGGV